MVLFSVIVPTCNRPQLVTAAVESVLGQTVDDFEVLVVNDGGEEPTGLSRDPRVRLYERRETGGPAAARNVALDLAQGRYVTFLDDDDLFTPRRLELALEGLRHTPVALCLRQSLGGPPPRPHRRYPSGLVADTIHDAGAPHLGCTALERVLAPRFDERYLACQDLEWWMRLAPLGAVTTIAEVGYLVRIHPQTRGLNGPTERLRFSRQLLLDYEDYFSTHPRARAFRLKRIGLFELRLGDPRAARRAFLASFRASPSARTALHLAGSYGRSG